MFLSPTLLSPLLFTKLKRGYWIVRFVLGSLELAFGCYLYAAFEQTPIAITDNTIIDPPDSIQLQYAYLRLFLIMSIVLSCLLKLFIEVQRFWFPYLWHHVDTFHSSQIQYKHMMMIRVGLYTDLGLLTIFQVLLVVFLATDDSKIGVINNNTNQHYYGMLIAAVFLTICHFVLKWVFAIWYLVFFRAFDVYDVSRAFFPWGFVEIQDMGPFFPQISGMSYEQNNSDDPDIAPNNAQQVVIYLDQLVHDKTIKERFEKCAICLDDSLDVDQLICLSRTCGHIFHYKCIGTWLTRKNTCPLCCRIVIGGNPIIITNIIEIV